MGKEKYKKYIGKTRKRGFFQSLFYIFNSQKVC